MVEPAVGAVLVYHVAFASTWEPYQFVAWAVVILVGFELLSLIVDRWQSIFGEKKQIPVRGKPLETLGALDNAFIWFNRFVSVLFVYHLLHYSYVWGHDGSGHVKWAPAEVTVANTVGSWAAFHVLYDLCYCLFHRGLHHRKVYRLIHKHHHKQKAPSRGNRDAVNVHPFEFICGEYLHLLSVAVIPSHIFTVAFFVIAGGFMASLNHTRYDIALPLGLFDVKYHDEHHVVPNSNYGQYTMLWDHILGTYRDHPAEEARKGGKKARRH